MNQTSLAHTIEITGVNVFTGEEAVAIIEPASDNSGLVFIINHEEIPATLAHAYNHRQWGSSCIGLKKGKEKAVKVEHAISAFYALGIDNARIHLPDGIFPRLNYSVANLVQRLSPLKKYTNSPKKQLTIDDSLEEETRTFSLHGKPDILSVKKSEEFRVTSEVFYPHKSIGHQEYSIHPSREYEKIMHARSPFFLPFGSRFLIDTLGRFHGVTDENALFIGRKSGARYLNKDGKPYDALEFVKHKIIDAIGAIALLGAQFMETEFIFSKTGHYFDLTALHEFSKRGVFIPYRSQESVPYSEKLSMKTQSL